MNKKNILSFFVRGIVMVVFLAPILTQAVTGPTSPGGGGPTGTQSPSKIITIKPPFKCGQGQTNCTLIDFINTIIDSILIPIGSVVAVLMIMYAGFLFVTARGNETQLKKAKEALLYACIGAAILLGAKVISLAIKGTISQL